MGAGATRRLLVGSRGLTLALALFVASRGLAQPLAPQDAAAEVAPATGATPLPADRDVAAAPDLSESSPSAPSFSSPAPTASAPAAPSPAAPPPEAPAPAAPPPSTAPAAADLRAATVAARSTPPASVNEVELALQEATAERANASRLWPLLVLGTGLATLLAGAAVGIVAAVGCETRCTAPPLAAASVLVGAGIASAGAVWLVHQNHAIERLESRKYKLEQLLEEQRFRRATPAAQARTPQLTALSVTF